MKLQLCLKQGLSSAAGVVKMSASQPVVRSIELNFP